MTKNLQTIIGEAINRHEAEAREYGPLDIERDSRDFIEEAVEELLDCINYAAYEILRLRRLRVTLRTLSEARQ